MKHFGSEIRQLRSFFEADGFDSQSIRTNPGIGGHDAVHVGADLDGLSVHSATDQSRRVVRSATAPGSGHAVDRGADKAAHYRYLPGIDQGLQMLAAPGFYQGAIRGRFPV